MHGGCEDKARCILGVRESPDTFSAEDLKIKNF